MTSNASSNNHQIKKSKRGATALSGVLLLDKPRGWTSHDLVNRLRRLTGERRIGHCGTLDPDASGLMVMLIGHATKLSTDFIIDRKSYRARISFGTSTTTDDADGQCVQQSDVPDIVLDADYAQAVLAQFMGKQSQVPPDFSALKQSGKVAYREARRGRPLQIEARDIQVYRAELVEIDVEAKTWIVDFEVSKGTYIRALARDIGLHCNTYAHLNELRRLSSGDFNIDDAYSIEDIENICEVSSLAVADLFLPREVLLQSVNQERLSAASVAGRRVGPSVITIGVFDGVHAGHRALLETVVQRAKEQNLLSAVVTFDQHPIAALRPFRVPAQLMSLEEKIDALKSCGIDEIVILPFNHSLSQQSTEDFLLKTVPCLAQAEEIVVGDNFRCGKGAECGPHQMREIFAAHNCQTAVTIADLKTDQNGVPYSSTRIREQSV